MTGRPAERGRGGEREEGRGEGREGGRKPGAPAGPGRQATSNGHEFREQGTSTGGQQGRR